MDLLSHPNRRIGSPTLNFAGVFAGKRLLQFIFALLLVLAAPRICNAALCTPPSVPRFLHVSQETRADGAHLIVCVAVDQGTVPLVYYWNWHIGQGPTLSSTTQDSCLDLRLDPANAEALVVSVTVSNACGSAGPATSVPIKPCTDCAAAQPFFGSAQAYTNEFETATPIVIKTNGSFGNYSVQFGGALPPDFTAVVGFDYSKITYPLPIPPAPKSRPGTTKGLYLSVNKDSSGQSAAVSVYPYQSSQPSEISPDFTVTYDVWVNWTNVATATEFATVGINHYGEAANAPGIFASDGVFFAMDGDGGMRADAADVRDFSIFSGEGPTNRPSLLLPQNTTFGPAPLLGTHFDNLDSGFANLFPSIAIPGYPSTPAGSPGLRWVRGEIRYLNDHITWLLDNTIVAEFDNPTSYRDGYVMLGCVDTLASIGSTNNFVIFDNLHVDPNPKVSRLTSWTVPENGGTRYYFSVDVEGTPPFVYKWQFYDENYNGWDEGYLEQTIQSSSTNSTLSRFFGPFDFRPKNFYINTERYRGLERVGFDGAYGSPPSCPPLCLSLGGAATLSSVSGSGTNFSYTTDCGSFPPGSRWFRLTALTKPGIATVSANGTTYDMNYAVFSGLPSSRSSLTAAGCAHNSPGGSSQIRFETKPDTYYWLVVTEPPAAASVRIASGYDLKIATATYTASPNVVEIRSAPIPALQYKISATDDFLKWDAVFTTNFTSSVSSSNILRFTDTPAANSKLRFYRIEAGP